MRCTFAIYIFQSCFQSHLCFLYNMQSQGLVVPRSWIMRIMFIRQCYVYACTDTVHVSTKHSMKKGVCTIRPLHNVYIYGSLPAYVRTFLFTNNKNPLLCTHNQCCIQDGCFPLCISRYIDITTPVMQFNVFLEGGGFVHIDRSTHMICVKQNKFMLNVLKLIQLANLRISSGQQQN